MKATLVFLLVLLSACSTKEDGTALIAASQLQADEFEGLANAFMRITEASNMDISQKQLILDRIFTARGNYARLKQASDMLIHALTEVDTARLVPEVDFWLNRYLPPPAPLPERPEQP